MAKEERDQKENQQNEFVEQESAEQGGAVQDFIDRNKKIVQYIGGGIGALILLGYFGYSYFQGQNEEAQVEMFPAVFYFEKDSLDLALNGDGSSLGFVDIIEDYSYTKAGNLAKFYAGACNLKLGNFEEAIDYLDGFSGGDVFVQARAYCMMGDAYTELDDTKNAISNYEKASDYKPNKSFTPMYLMKLGLAYETANRWEDAARAYGRLVKEFPTAAEINDAKKFKARAEIEMTNT
jgi:tetratricopeptide (TPR) repeat protein